MKSLQTLVSIAVIGTIIALSGCGGGGGSAEPATDKQLTLLSKTWKLKSLTGGSVFKAGADSTTRGWNNGFTLTISGTKGQTTFNYACANRPPLSVWKSAGTFQFNSDPKKVTTDLTRDDGAAVTYAVDASGSNLQLKFSFSGAGYSRTSNVQGDWIFNLIPN